MRALHLYIWILSILVIGVVLVTWMSMYKEGFQVTTINPTLGLPQGGLQVNTSVTAPITGPVVNNTTGQIINQTLSDADKKQIKDRYFTIMNSINTPTVNTYNLYGDDDYATVRVNLTARYIRLRPSRIAADGYMYLSGVDVYDMSNNNISRNKSVKVQASSTAQGGLSPQNLVRGSGSAKQWPNIWKTNGQDRDKEFLLIDLASIQNISSITVFGEYLESKTNQRINGMRLEVTVDHSQELASVSDPSPNDSIPITFPTNISAYSLAKFQSPATARGALMIDYNNLENEMATVVYDPAKRAAWSADAQTETCAQLDKLYTMFKTKQQDTLAKAQDISGAMDLTGQLHDDSINFQTAYQSKCLQTPMSDACKNLASQDGPLFSLLAQYNTSQYDLYSGQVDISDNIQTIRDVYTILNCPKKADMAMPTGNELGTIDTTALTVKLQSFSPYYLSPDILQNIVRSIVSANDVGGTLQYTSDTLVNINQIVNNIKTLTNTP
jgi:hypothetical protein